MSDEIEDIDLDDLEKRMVGAVNSLKHDFSSLRTGRASASMLDAITVDAYGSSMPINQCATINVPEPRMVSVSVWDKQLVNAVDKAIRNAGLGINPVMDGTTLRLPIPELNEERRRDLAKMAGHYAENARIAVRNVRKDGMDQLKKLKDSMSEDDQKIWADEIQELTNATIVKIDKALEAKQEEIMQV
ncbi:MAG TPA: ribosome recycling factor [Paracoccaceae bacterium]|nr:ribosome recycling factor [Paracoccaceae bacterium]